MQDLFSLTGKVAVITGGSGGIGLGIAKSLARAGAAVAIVGRNSGKPAAASAGLAAGGATALAIQADVSVEDDVTRLVGDTVARFGRIDILVNNAAISYGILPQDMSLEVWNNFIAVNLTSAFLCAKACYLEMLKAGSGKIINISSIITQFGHPKLAHYAAAKGGMDHMAQSLACAWGPDNIQVNAVLPGLVHTEMMPCEGPNSRGPIVEYLVNRTAVKRYGMPADFAGIAILLASRASDFITGSIIIVDGGLSLAM
ncbi:MAG: SDR family oxidoreductase [Gammaproteobacteria bacterium]|nr:SDR family oxidoreductase [Gammaproteobacteria bacterium]